MLTAERLRELVTYDATSGQFFWRVDRARLAKAGAKLGFAASGGYRCASVGGRVYSLHRLAWLYVYGELPGKQIDHINGDRADNRIANLRLATPRQQCGNRKVRSDNSSGHAGVSFRDDIRKWAARITVHGKQKHLGYFQTKEAAIAARKQAAERVFGEFAAHLSRSSVPAYRPTQSETSNASAK